MSKIVDRLETELRKQADLNKDGQLTKADVSIALNRARAATEEQTRARPLGALLMVTVAAGVIGFWFRGVFAC